MQSMFVHSSYKIQLCSGLGFFHSLCLSLSLIGKAVYNLFFSSLLMLMWQPLQNDTVLCLQTWGEKKNIFSLSLCTFTQWCCAIYIILQHKLKASTIWKISGHIKQTKHLNRTCWEVFFSSFKNPWSCFEHEQQHSISCEELVSC